MDPSRNQAAIDATRELLTTVGYAGFSMDDVSRRIGSSKNTIYRRWPSKVALVMASITGDTPQRAHASASLREDLLSLAASHLGAADGMSVPVLAGVLWAMRTDQELADAVLHEIAETRNSEFLGALTAAHDRGEITEIPKNWRQIGELLPAVLMYRFAVSQPTDMHDLEQIIDDVVLPLVRPPQSASAHSPRRASSEPHRTKDKSAPRDVQVPTTGTWLEGGN
ncbi:MULTISPECIES: TetR/AcrR family transcriptional regulator [unclassified Mycobacteroides]|uniref:TetR/AcrR family transcriptional regulator n=1 Tax=unclassified Mycobacteroides TaxID=2618759 RepID=UPI00193E0FE8|nr:MULTISPECIES: TetR/AcrR family transcriptional regulator [unclassified Mycobacteroides]